MFLSLRNADPTPWFCSTSPDTPLSADLIPGPRLHVMRPPHWPESQRGSAVQIPYDNPLSQPSSNPHLSPSLFFPRLCLSVYVSVSIHCLSLSTHCLSQLYLPSAFSLTLSFYLSFFLNSFSQISLPVPSFAHFF